MPLRGLNQRSSSRSRGLPRWPSPKQNGRSWLAAEKPSLLRQRNSSKSSSLAHRVTIHRCSSLPQRLPILHSRPRRSSIDRSRHPRLCPQRPRHHHRHRPMHHRLSPRRRRSLIMQHLRTPHHRHRPPPILHPSKGLGHRNRGLGHRNNCQCRTSSDTALVTGQCTW